MGDRNRTTLGKARQELEDLYTGIPDESVDLTFKDLLSFPQEEAIEKKVIAMSPVHEETEEEPKKSWFPSLDLEKNMHESKEQRCHTRLEDELYEERIVRNNVGNSRAAESNQAYNDWHGFSEAMSPFGEAKGRRPQGIPHSNICALCSKYIRFFRHRCLVCGRVYCRKCVVIGMGAMTEGRKCIDCLGRRFSQRYIQKAGETGCYWRYPSLVKQQELIWAEKGPMRTSERQHGRSTMASKAVNQELQGTPPRPHQSRPMSPMVPGTPSRSYVRGSPCGPYGCPA